MYVGAELAGSNLLFVTTCIIGASDRERLLSDNGTPKRDTAVVTKMGGGRLRHCQRLFLSLSALRRCRCEVLNVMVYSSRCWSEACVAGPRPAGPGPITVSVDRRMALAELLDVIHEKLGTSRSRHTHAVCEASTPTPATSDSVPIAEVGNGVLCAVRKSVHRCVPCTPLPQECMACTHRIGITGWCRC